MAIDLQALDMFRTAENWTATGVARLDGDDAIKQNGTYSGPLSALTRSETEQTENNRVRTELLRALGNAFGLSGMSEEDGTVTFSKKFMDKLEKLLGADFKRDDFKMDAEGNVTSGRPLTARRIQAILAKVEKAAEKAGTEGASSAESASETEAENTSETEEDYGSEAAEYSATKAPEAGTSETAKTSASKAAKPGKKSLSRTGGLRRDETYKPYLDTLAGIKKDISRLDKKKFEHVHTFFTRIEKSLDFLYNELDVTRRHPDADDPSGLRISPEYEFLKSIGDLKEDDRPTFQYYDTKSAKFLTYNPSTYQNDVLWHKLGGGLLHLERAKFRSGESEDIAPLRKYIVENTFLFVKKSIDCYVAAKETGKLDLYFEHLRSPGACIEDQALHMVEFEAKNLTTGETYSAKEAEELERIANQDPEKLATPDIDQQINTIYDEIGNEQWFLDKEAFDDDIAKVLNERLLGKTCTITKYDKSNHKFEPLLQNGKPVVRPLTAEDIRAFGALIFKETFM